MLGVEIMPNLLKGALIEYGNDFLGPLKNVVIFQFNPETLTRDLRSPPRPTGAKGREQDSVGDIPVERITLTVHFSAADQLEKNNPSARSAGIGSQLAALEKMVYPIKIITGLNKKPPTTTDKTASSINIDSENTNQPTPRDKYPRILFIWGLKRILPVIIDSMNIAEQQYDNRLNPIQAEVTLGLVVKSEENLDDDISKGAIKYTNIEKEIEAVGNLANTAQQVIDLIPF